MISKIIEAQVLLSDNIVSILVPQLLKIFDECVLGSACIDVLEPGDVGTDFVTGDDRDQVALAQTGAQGKLGFGLVDDGVVEMQAQVSVDVKREVQYGGALVNIHGSAVTAEDPDLLVVSVARFYLIDIVDREIGIGINDAAVEESLVFELSANEKSIHVVHFVGEQEVTGAFVGSKAVLEQVEAL